MYYSICQLGLQQEKIKVTCLRETIVASRPFKQRFWRTVSLFFIIATAHTVDEI